MSAPASFSEDGERRTENGRAEDGKISSVVCPLVLLVCRLLSYAAARSLLSVYVERWPIAGAFTISRGAKTEAVVVVAELADGQHRGRGECVPYLRYGETVEAVVTAIEANAAAIAAGLDRVQACRPAWRRARHATRSIARSGTWRRSAPAGGRMSSPALPAPKPVITAYTISLASPGEMAAAAAKAADRAVLKIKLGGPRRPRPDRGGAARGAALRVDRRCQRGLVGATTSPTNLAACAQAGVDLGRAAAARRPATMRSRACARPLPVCADESAHGLASLRRCAANTTQSISSSTRAGGLTEALAMAARGRTAGLDRHGRLHGGDLARHRACDAGCAACANRRPRRTAPARPRPSRWARLREQPRSSADPRIMGVKRTRK